MRIRDPQGKPSAHLSLTIHAAAQMIDFVERERHFEPNACEGNSPQTVLGLKSQPPDLRRFRVYPCFFPITKVVPVGLEKS
jgi:hypothetical protein